MATATDAGTSEVQHKRATVRPDKGDAVAELVSHFTESSAAVLTEYRGLTVKQISELRRALGADTTYSVVKNTLSKIAAGQAGLTGADDLLSGPTAVAFVGGDPVTAAKSLRDFAKANPALIVKGGFMDGRAMSADEVRKLADLESREVLLAKLAGAMKASLTQAVYLFAAPLSQAARALGALQAQVEQNGPASGSADEAGASAAEPTSESTSEISTDETSASEAPAEASTDETSTDETSTDETSTGETSTDETSTDETRTENA